MHRVLRFERAQRMKEYVRNIAPGIFLQELLSKPGTVGAVCPSSRFLAASMAQEVPQDEEGLVIELGAGTGVVTQALLNHGVDPSDLLVIEYSAVFVQRLRQRFNNLNIVHGNAADLCQLVPAGRKVRCIVSSLPLCSLPRTVTQAILQQWLTLLRPGNVAIQFTYHLREPEWSKNLAMLRTNSKIVWANFPPANVSTYSVEQTQEGTFVR